MRHGLSRTGFFGTRTFGHVLPLIIMVAVTALLLIALFAPDIASAEDATTKGKEIYGWFFYQILTLFAWVTGLAGIVLNAAAYYTVVNMGNFVNGLSAITAAWTVLRDVGNIVLIFGFVAIGIATILDVESYSAKKMLVKLLIVAVTLNFSMFVTRAIIDVGNVVATQFYKELNGGSLTKPTLAIGEEGISNAIMGALKLTSVYNGGKGSDVSQNLKENRWTVFVLGMFLFAIATFVLFSIAFMLIGRFVILVFLMIVSPLGFVGLIVPRFDKQAKEWWSKLIDQTLFAPAVMLLLLIAIKVMSDPSFFGGSGGSGDWGAVMEGNYQTLAGLALSFLIAMGLLMASLLIAKQLSAFGASTSTKLAGKLSFGALAAGAGIGIGGSARISRGIVQRIPGFKNTAAARVLTNRVFRPLETANLDMRRIPGVGKVLTTMGAGEAAKGVSGVSYRDIRALPKKMSDSSRELTMEYEKEMKDISRDRTLTSGTDDQKQKELLKMSADEVAELRDIRAGMSSLVNNLSPERFNELMGSKKLTNVEKASIRKTWEAQITSSPASAATLLNRLSGNQVAQLDTNLLTHANAMNSFEMEDLEGIRRAGKLTQAQKAIIHRHLSAAGGPAWYTAYRGADPARTAYWT